MRALSQTCLAVIALLTANCSTSGADQSASSQRVCFDPDHVRNFQYQARNTMMVETFKREKFLLTLSGVCPDLESANGIGFTDIYAGDVCSNTRASLVYNGMSFGRQSCRIANVERAPESPPAGPSPRE
ncbi:MAG: hypothetical protein JNM81_05585 [Rhodospirillaceae bacterium]|nr:hypothetical protein [Rhodospirillaceae bacterium]